MSPHAADGTAASPAASSPAAASPGAETEGQRLGAARRLVVKIGSALLVNESDGTIRYDWLAALADDLALLRDRGLEVLVVSSGSVAVGRRHLGLPRGQVRLEDKQAAAATGQIRLAHAYQEALARHGITVAQVLVTLEDTEARRRHLNARNTMEQLLRHGAIPVVNENDTVTTEQIRVGDNDRLAARVAQMVSADTLVLLSDIDGLYTADPRRDPTARHIPLVGELSAGIESMAGAPLPGVGSGGMITKLQAARIAVAAGCRMVIAAGHEAHALRALLEDPARRCTWFTSQATPLSARKRWIAGSLAPVGSIGIDAGAVLALRRGKSLLPAGVISVHGAFRRGDCVAVRDQTGKSVGRGLIAYDSADAAAIAGRRTTEIADVLGYRGRDAMIHVDDLVLD